jgi:hypothetical protein
VDNSPLRRRGICHILVEHGFEVDAGMALEEEDVSGWAHGDGPRALVVTLNDACQVSLLRALRGARGDLALVALLPADASVEAYQSAL